MGHFTLNWGSQGCARTCPWGLEGCWVGLREAELETEILRGALKPRLSHSTWLERSDDAMSQGREGSAGI